MKLLWETNPEGNLISPNLYETKKLVSKLGLKHKKIDCCMNGCMLYYKDNEDGRHYKFYRIPWYKEPRWGEKRYKEVPMERMYFLPFIPGLKGYMLLSDRLNTWDGIMKIDNKKRYYVTHLMEKYGSIFDKNISWFCFWYSKCLVGLMCKWV